MNPKQAAVRAAALKVLSDKVKAANDEAKSEALGVLDPGDKLSASYQGAKLGSVSVSNGRVSARVTDPEAFAAWVAEHYPTEVVHKPVVRDAFAKAVLDASKNAGEPCAPDGTLDVPGVQVSEGDPYVSVRLAEGAEEVVRRMVADGAMELDGRMRPELEGGA